MTMGWPSVEQLAQMGLVRCTHSGCSVFVEPVNFPGGKCRAHKREDRASRLVHRDAVVPFLPRQGRRAA